MGHEEDAPEEEVEVVRGDQAKGLDRLTDRVGERELTADPTASAEGLTLAHICRPMDVKEKEAMTAREGELSKVKVAAADVAIIVSEMEVETKAAEQRLREHGGDIVAALRSYVH